MSKFLDAKTEKWIILTAMGILAYSKLSSIYTNLPQVPAILSNELVAGISLIGIAAALTLYGTWVFAKY